MNLLYSISIYLLSFVLKCIAPFNKKIEQGVVGRRQTFRLLESALSSRDKTLWFHCASLGEYEQGLPVFKALRNDFPDHKIVLSFFSPSGYEIRKNSPIADVVVYLPLDTKSNAKRFLDVVHPEITIFVKYEIWPNILNTLKTRGGKALLISAIFRENQSFFKWYGTQTKAALFTFDHIFTQNKTSKQLLKRINYTSVTVSGDTRFDRVTDQLSQNNQLDFIEEFKQNELCVVIGSSWPEDEALLINYINTEAPKDIKFIIAPHTIKESQIVTIKRQINKPTILFSEKENQVLSTFSVLVLDTIGLLTKVYSYADIAYVGGALGTTGLHNILEPAVFGTPIIIGNRFDSFPEAHQMLSHKGLISISNQQELNKALHLFINDRAVRASYGQNNLNFIKNNRGAVVQILAYIRKYNIPSTH
ncbi:3-deoxy-D-manno-octulosonic acid transferase [Bizionia saleffrena]|uniref:3-deoxy-D-manno-octulosonic acid transferase n=1 Tax=Bizionia saleffrena TaxID=291189 RepID=A0A8H2QEB8_9FLAO|nr:glycosyltransferase N-terminal domain-containing protein [Bizionia saleffrena]TYB73958.1 3-deoxy-D-manno-octulosonic acid transferase [Bizionia saleffrena]